MYLVQHWLITWVLLFVRFTVITQGEVSELHGQIAEFRARYDSEGPGTVGDQFDVGEHKMKVRTTYYQPRY